MNHDHCGTMDADPFWQWCERESDRLTVAYQAFLGRGLGAGSTEIQRLEAASHELGKVMATYRYTHGDWKKS